MLPTELILNTIKNINPEDLSNICSQNKKMRDICKNNFNIISKYFLDKFQVDYQDPNNFIYRYHKENIDNFKNGNKWSFDSIFKLYMKMYYEDEIDCENLGITSFPIYPNMTHFYGNNNKLTTFPIQPKMEIFFGDNNKLTSFPVQPKMTHFYGNNNQLISFPIQPKMEEFEGDNNQLTSFPIQPNMFAFSGNKNKIKEFFSQPKLEILSIIGNKNVKIHEQKNLTFTNM